MLAAVQVGYGAIRTSLSLDDVSIPPPRPGEVLLRVEGSTLNRKDLLALVRSLGSGRLKPVVHSTIPLTAIHDGLEAMERRDFFGKIEVRVGAR